ncbi:MAG: hypothetical protein RL354_2031, partial [Planctomycetota bacterium]
MPPGSQPTPVLRSTRRRARSGQAFAASGALVALAADGKGRLAESGTIDSARLDASLVGSARSPAFGVSKRFLHVRVRGASSWLRVLIDNYWLDAANALLFEGMRRRLGDADAEHAARDPRDWEWRVETFDLVRFTGERAYIELLDDGGGWIEVDAVLASDDAQVPAAELWDIDSTALAVDLIAPPMDAAFARAVAARDALRACTPPVRALVAEDSGAFDEPVHVRGSPRNYGAVVPRAELSILRGGADAGSLGVVGSGRLRLAQEITDPLRPYLWRT